MVDLNIPVGVSDFEKLRENNYYYIDKTGFISKLLQTKSAEVTLITRPRRFGKTLGMRMLASFFDIRKDSRTIFEGLEISKNTALCDEWMNQYPTLFLSFKDVDGLTFSSACDMLVYTISDLYQQHLYLLESDSVNDYDKEIIHHIAERKATVSEIKQSLVLLTKALASYYAKPVILLLDEYDVPIAKASSNGYYDQMLEIIKGMLSTSLKDNAALRFAVITGCLRIAKESIFTGLNNFKVYSITDKSFDETFGFTDAEVKELLRYYGQEKYYETVKEWYDGYRFGNVDVYCPWDVINFCSDHLADPGLEPKNYWANTSGNSVISHFIDSVGKPQKLTRMELEQLVNGGIVQKEINSELTYKELYSSIDNLWSTLFMTGYLTQRGEPSGNRYNLVIPNREIRNIITNHILKMFKENVKDDGKTVSDLCDALLNKNPEKVELIFTEYMKKTISIRDTFARKPTKENFYHGLLLGILGFKENWSVMSNRESGDGFGDILIRIEDEDVGIVIEVKYADDGNLQGECEKALQQIIDIRYTEALEQEGIHTIIKYGIACYRKKCKVLMRIDKQ